MIAGCIITYRDWPLIKDCVESLKDKVDKIIVVDGRYKDFNSDFDYSDEETIKYLLSIKNLRLIFGDITDEVTKRNRYLSQLSDGDIVLNLDSDEVLIGELPELKSDFGILDLVDGYGRHVQKRATRFFRYRKGMEYKYCHYTMYYDNKIVNKLQKVVNPDFSFEYISSCKILHNWHLRSDERKYMKEIYYKKLIIKESGFDK